MRVGVVVVAFGMLGGCGKKGPPLAPYSSAPGAPTEISIRRKGDQVEIRFKVPVANSDGRRPAHIDHVEVYGLTLPGEEARAKEHEAGKTKPHVTSGSPSKANAGAGAGAGGPEQMPIRKYGTVVSSLLVREPPPPPEEVKEGEPPPPPPPPRTDPGLDQGDQVLVIDTLTPQSLVPVEIPEKSSKHEPEPRKRLREPLLTPPDLGPPLPQPSLRYYAVAGKNGGKKGVLPPPVAVPVADLPPAPPTPTVTVAEGKIQIAITAPDGLRTAVFPLMPSTIDANGAIVKSTARPSGAATLVPGAAPAPVAPVAPVAQAAPVSSESEDEDTVPVVPPPAVVPPPVSATPVASASAAAAASASAAPAATSDKTADKPVAAAGEDEAAPIPCTPAPASAAASAAAAASASAAPAASASAAPAAPAATADKTADKPVASVAPVVPCVSTLLRAKLLSSFQTPVYGYMVYEMAPPDFKPPVQQPGAAPPYPVLLTTVPVSAGTWNDNRFVVGADRCYSVRTVATIGPITSESAATPTVCVKTVDTFPPAAPKNLQAVASEGTISLIWDTNSEADLAGYIVLRAQAGSDKLTAITPTPIKEATYRDTKVKAGVRYAYAVVAVDTASPQNVSAQSNRVEETAR